MTWLIRFLLFLLLLMIVRVLLARLFNLLSGSSRAAAGGRPQQPRRGIVGQTVKDPQCGMYVAKDLAVAMSKGRETLYFCSVECKDEFLKTR